MIIFEIILNLLIAIGASYILYLACTGNYQVKYPSEISYGGKLFKRTFGNRYKCVGEIPVEIQEEAMIKFDIEIIK